MVADPEEGVPVQPEIGNAKYLRWARVLVSALSFGMIFPNAFIERLERSAPLPYLDTIEKDKNR